MAAVQQKNHKKKKTEMKVSIVGEEVDKRKERDLRRHGFFWSFFHPPLLLLLLLLLLCDAGDYIREEIPVVVYNFPLKSTI